MTRDEATTKTLSHFASIGLPLNPMQRGALESRSEVVHVSGGRGSGKTFTVGASATALRSRSTRS